MKTLGVLGGIGPESTIEYYRFILAAYRELRPDGSAPPVIINSIDVNKMLGMIGAKQLPEVTDYLADELGRLVQAGAGLGLMASNTPHIVFDEVQRRLPIPLVSIVQATCDETKSLGLKKVGLFGTRFTMQAGFYQKIFSSAGLEVAVPYPTEQDYIHDKYMNELLKTIILPETRSKLLAIAAGMKERQGIQGLILGGTELPLILRDPGSVGIPFLDTTRIHVQAAVKQLLA
jgi:aspartate racemase